jgi:hypothetical protein
MSTIQVFETKDREQIRDQLALAVVEIKKFTGKQSETKRMLGDLIVRCAEKGRSELGLSLCIVYQFAVANSDDSLLAVLLSLRADHPVAPRRN